MAGVENSRRGGWGEAGSGLRGKRGMMQTSEGCGWPGRSVLLLRSGFLVTAALNMEDPGSA